MSRQGTFIGYIEAMSGASPDGVTVRPLQPADSISDVTRLLHSAYASLSAPRVRFWASPPRGGLGARLPFLGQPSERREHPAADRGRGLPGRGAGRTDRRHHYPQEEGADQRLEIGSAHV